MLSTAEINALRLRLAKERITHDMGLAMRVHAVEPGMESPIDWRSEPYRNPAELMRATSTTRR